MRLSEPRETSGSFWLPDEPNERLSGRLKISESSEITVELSGTFGDPFDTLSEMGVVQTSAVEKEGPDLSRIVGILEKGGPITLDGCFLKDLHIGLTSGLFPSMVHAELAYIGAEYHKQEEVSFTELRLSVEGLDDWLSVSGIEVERNVATESVSIQYRPPDEISIVLPCGTEIRFAFSLTSPSVSLPLTTVSMTQVAYVYIKLKEPQSIEYFSSIAFKLCNFLSLVLNQGVSIQSMTGYLAQKTQDGQTRQMPVEVYAQFGPWTERIPTIRWHHALFLYPDVACQLNDIMTKWFESYEIFEPAFNLYFASSTQASQFLDTKVLWLAQALETLHRRSSDDTEMSEEDFSSLRESVILSCEADRRKWLEQKLRYANKLTLRRRLIKLLEPFKRWFGTSKERRSFVAMAYDTRNYLTHYDEDTTKKRATEPSELFELYGKLEALFDLSSGLRRRLSRPPEAQSTGRRTGPRAWIGVPVELPASGQVAAPSEGLFLLHRYSVLDKKALCRNAPAATLVDTIEAAMGSPKPRIAGTHGVMQSTIADSRIPRGVGGAVVTNITYTMMVITIWAVTAPPGVVSFRNSMNEPAPVTGSAKEAGRTTAGWVR